jgi:hypothetical protein
MSAKALFAKSAVGTWSRYYHSLRIRRQLLLFLVGFLLCLAAGSRADELYGAVHFIGGANKNPATIPAFSAGFHIDLALFSRIRLQVLEVGLSYDRVQSHSGASIDLRARVPLLRCYAWELNCGAKRFWVTGVPSVGNRWGPGGFGGYAGAQIQAVFDLRREYACCKLAVGIQHRFPFNSSLRADNSLVLELRTVIEFRDRRPPPPSTEHD